MLAGELVSIVEDIIKKRCEMQNVELKAAEKGCPQRLYDTLSSFANQQNGGTIIFGIEQENNYSICGVYDPQDLQTKVTEQANQMSPIIRPLFTVAQIDGKIIISAEIAECDIFEKPCFYKGAGRMRGSYIRVGDADMPMTEYEIYSYEAFRQKIQDELRPVRDIDTKLLNSTALEEYYYKIKQTKENLAGLPNNQILQLQGIKIDERLTLAGLMLFGVYPQAFFPQLCITAVVAPGLKIGETGSEGERFIDNKRIEGTIPQMLEGALVFIRRNMKTRTIIDGDGKRADKPEYPLIAIRELVLNALIHRDYSIHTDSSPIRIMMFENRLEIENPGGLYGRLTLDNLGKIGADTRNPYIAGTLEILINTENRFSGIPTVLFEMERSGLKKPLFENYRGTFKVTLFNAREDSTVRSLKKGDLPEDILEFCRIPRSRGELAQYFGFEAASYMIKKYIDPLVKTGRLHMLRPDKPKSKNQKYVAADK